MGIDNIDRDVVMAQSDYDELIDSVQEARDLLKLAREKIATLKRENVKANCDVNFAYAYGYNSCEDGKKFIYGFTVEHLEPLH